MIRSPLPWRTDGASVRDANGRMVADCMTAEVTAAEMDGNAAAIARAVNHHGTMLALLKHAHEWLGENIEVIAAALLRHEDEVELRRIAQLIGYELAAVEKEDAQ